jgi:hypothetical protein
VTYTFDTADDLSFRKYPFEISPRNFLQFANEDLKANNIRGWVNSITNAKRCIDCETDKFLYAIGIKQNWEKCKNTVKQYIKNSTGAKKFHDDIPIGLQLLDALNISPWLLVSKYRKIRNKVEHEYRKPNYADVIEAVEIAQLFLGCVEEGISHIGKFLISSSKQNGNIFFQYRIGEFSTTATRQDQECTNHEINVSDLEYYSLFRIAKFWKEPYADNIREAHYDLMKSIGLKLPDKSMHSPDIEYL